MKTIALRATQIDHEFAGLIEQEFGKGYSPTDDTGHALGVFATLGDAKTALTAVHPDEPLSTRTP